MTSALCIISYTTKRNSLGWELKKSICQTLKVLTRTNDAQKRGCPWDISLSRAAAKPNKSCWVRQRWGLWQSVKPRRAKCSVLFWLESTSATDRRRESAEVSAAGWRISSLKGNKNIEKQPEKKRVNYWRYFIISVAVHLLCVHLFHLFLHQPVISYIFPECFQCHLLLIYLYLGYLFSKQGSQFPPEVLEWHLFFTTEHDTFSIIQTVLSSLIDITKFLLSPFDLLSRLFTVASLGLFWEEMHVLVFMLIFFLTSLQVKPE